MKNWISISDRLRAVKQAHQDYLFRAFVDRLIIGPMLLDRLAADLGATRPGRLKKGRLPVQNLPRPTDDE